jgi:hypothetical protein
MKFAAQPDGEIAQANPINCRHLIYIHVTALLYPRPAGQPML